MKIRNAFEPPAEIGELCSNMLFADYLLGWLEIVKVRVKPTTFGSYESMVKQTIEPYFRNKPITLKDLEARHIQQFYSEKLKTVKPNSVIHYHAVIHQALKYAMKTDSGDAKCSDEGRPSKEERFPAGISGCGRAPALI